MTDTKIPNIKQPSYPDPSIKTELEKFLSNYQPLDKHRHSDAINAARREALEYASDLRSCKSEEDREILTKHVIRLSTIYTYLTGRNLDLNLPS